LKKKKRFQKVSEKEESILSLRALYQLMENYHNLLNKLLDKQQELQLQLAAIRNSAKYLTRSQLDVRAEVEVLFTQKIIENNLLRTMETHKVMEVLMMIVTLLEYDLQENNKA
jgi:hypothetical protein